MYKEIKLLINGCSFYSNKLAVELSHLIGFKSIAMEFPLAVFENSFDKDTLLFSVSENLKERPEGFEVKALDNIVQINVSPSCDAVQKAYNHIRENYSALTGGFGEGTHEVSAPHDFRATKNMPLAAFDLRDKKGLESLFDKDFILRDDNLDLLPDRIDAKILLNDSLDKEQVAAACNLAARLGLETTVISYPITTDSETENNLFVFANGIECGLSLEEGPNYRFVFTGDGQDLINFSAAFCETFPLQKPGVRLIDILEEMTTGLCMQNVDGQLAHLDSVKDKITDDTKCYFSPKIHDVDETTLKSYAPAEFKGHRDLKMVHEKEFDIPWEVDVCKDLLNEKLWSKVKPGDEVEIRAILSEDKLSREKLTKEFADIAESKGAKLTLSEVICAYKQGFSWLEDIVMPKLKTLSQADRIEIFFKPFMAPGVTEWADEDGTVPTYNNLNTDNENKWFDLPIRYLQELYPVDDILAEGLEIPRENIIFTEYKGDLDITYFATASEGNKMLWEGAYKATNQQRSYIDAYPGMGKVHPSTGWVYATVNGEEVLNERVATDLELVWNIYQTEILPFCKKYAEEKTGGKPTTSLQPFFAQMRLDLLLSEPNEKLSCREDLFSSLDTLHEDIYFVGLDFFKLFGNTTAGEIFDAPGLILPVIKKHYGKPYFKFTLFDQHSLEPMIDFGNKQVKPTLCKKDLCVTIPKVNWINGKLSPVVKVEGSNSLTAVVKSYANLLSERKLAIENRFAFIDTMQFEIEGQTFNASVKETAGPAKDLCIKDINIYEDEMIGYEQYLEVIDKLKRVPGLSVYLGGETYQGRDIYVVEFLTNLKGYVSRTKRINQNPSLFINARHHANEPSATNSAFMTIKELLTNDEYKNLTDKLNLVVVPFENADGAAVHYELQKDNPNWIFHIARFNSIGKEFYHEHFKDDTMHIEAKCLTKIWQRWLPDIIVDNHGVPTHEWAQQFSGYASPSYKGFWLPRSLLYGCFWTVKEECFADNIKVAKKIEDIVADVIDGDDKLKKLNKEYQDRFDKYATRWLPRMFPANFYRDMINAWMSYDFDPNHRYPSVRFPWITTVAYTSEITDETAQGDFLQMCADTHTRHDLGIIKMLRDSKCAFDTSVTETNKGISQAHRRQRPLITN